MYEYEHFRRPSKLWEEGHRDGNQNFMGHGIELCRNIPGMRRFNSTEGAHCDVMQEKPLNIKGVAQLGSSNTVADAQYQMYDIWYGQVEVGYPDFRESKSNYGRWTCLPRKLRESRYGIESIMQRSNLSFFWNLSYTKSTRLPKKELVSCVTWVEFGESQHTHPHYSATKIYYCNHIQRIATVYRLTYQP